MSNSDRDTSGAAADEARASTAAAASASSPAPASAASSSSGSSGPAPAHASAAASTSATAASSSSSASASSPAPAPASASVGPPLLAPQAGLGLVHRSPGLKAIAALAPLPPASTASNAQSSSTNAAKDDGAGAAPPSLALDTDSAAPAPAPAPSDDDGATPAGEHLLHQTWTFWYDVADSGGKKEWGASLKKLMHFNSVEQFWGMLNNVCKPSHLPQKSDYHLFRHGIKPEWEDPQNRAGGKWVWEVKHMEGLDQAWLSTLLFLIGEQSSDEHEALGAVVSLRKGRNKIALWTRSSQNKQLLLRLGAEWRKVLAISNAVAINFFSHGQAMKVGARSGEMQPLYTV